MVAAVQPLLSGGVSKTLNLPAETTPETIESVFLDAWRMGLKSIAVYRQGSKIVQPLHATGSGEDRV
jgi:ribonucleoside-diphosphate reductase alpha chain